ncbi:ABC transporter substrate-binding protein [Ruixingdingia sedimenti]|uniref:ABC transporter substrate-binding protein n=1 Tax=Ruixingdingia sedimenti TaxID=3073604 RepID=A0ABU1FCH3_9RHOB|nr:ABC transporter substrate-binding protein [Xinfangfangia sp. LG-4]MDR5654588.1 ABC transporter substrate-binding protein [Xinfangfangia sp. LG-4]
MRTSILIPAGLALCAATAGLPAAADTVKFGLVMPYSGWFQPIDASTVNGAMLAIKEINATGGVLGQEIEAVSFDNKSEPLLGADGALEVIGKGAKAIIVPSDFDFGAPGAFVAQQNGVISFSGASDPKFGVGGIGNLAYSLSTASQAQGALLAEWAFEQQGWKTAYVLLDDTIAYTKSLCGSFADRWKDLAGDAGLLGNDTFLNGDPTIAAQVSRINGLAAKPDVVMLCSYAPGGPSAIRQLRAAGLDQPIMTGESMDGDYWAGTVPGLSNFYVVNFGSFYGDDSDPGIADFFARYQAEYGQRADVSYALRGYSMVQAWARAAEKAGSVEAAEVAKVLDTFADEPLAVGPTTFTPDLHIATTRPMTIVQSKDGAFSFVTKVTARDFSLD